MLVRTGTVALTGSAAIIAATSVASANLTSDRNPKRSITLVLGDTDTRIDTVDGLGVALVCIQALHHRIDELTNEIDQLRGGRG